MIDDNEVSLGEEVRGIAIEGRAYVEAEIGFQKARIAYALGAGKTIVLLVLLALALAFFVLMALVMGLLLSLASLIGPWLATLAVVGLLFAGVAGSLLSALARFRRMKAVLTEGDEA